MSDPVTTAAPAAPAAAPAAPASSAAATLYGDAPAAAPAAAPVAAPATPGDAPPAAAEPAALALPGKDATPEQWAEFYGKLGRPEKADEYGLTVREGEDPAFIGEVAATMHKYGLTKEQATGLQKDLMAKADERISAAETARVKALDTKNQAEQASLKQELGEQFDGKMELAKRAVRQFASPDQAADVLTAIEDKIGYKATMQLWMSIGAGLGEHDAGGAAKGAADGERKPTQNVLYGGT